MTHAHSDHCPILVELHGEELADLGEKPFKFQAAWLLHGEFQNMLRRNWQWSGDLTCLLKCLAEKLRAWNRDTFVNIFWQKKRLRKRLEGVTKALDERPTVGHLKLELKLKRDWSDVLSQEGVLWMQKSCIDWLRMGDQNTKLFNMSTLIRRRRNRVVMLQNEEGTLVENAKQLKDMALSFYKRLFTSDQLADGDFVTGYFLRMDANTLKELGKDVTMEETKRALSDMGSFKAPGSDGFQAIFFKKTWETTGPAVHLFVKKAIEEGKMPEEAAEAALVLIPKE